MKLLFAAGDVGGARAILPVASLAHGHGHQVHAFAHGVLQDEGDQEWTWLDFQQSIDAAEGCDAVIYATSVKDMLAVEIASHAGRHGVPSIHVLDNWSSYARRVDTFTPDVYAVMDDLAYARAVEDGVTPSILRVAGHPGLAGLASESATMPHSVTPGTLLFVSEPAARDGGVAKRGYDETIVAKLFVQEIAHHADDVEQVFMVPHPREDRGAFEARTAGLFGSCTKELKWSVVARDGVRQALHQSSHIVGMSSLMLYEAWLLGRPVLSLQPGLKDIGLRELKERSGLVFHDKCDDISLSMKRWLGTMPGAPRRELAQHEQAAACILEMAKETAAARKAGESE